MKQTIIFLLSCAALASPAPADNWQGLDLYNYYTDEDSTLDHYTLFLLHVADTTYSEFATTLGSLTYEEFHPNTLPQSTRSRIEITQE